MQEILDTITGPIQSALTASLLIFAAVILFAAIVATVGIFLIRSTK